MLALLDFEIKVTQLSNNIDELEKTISNLGSEGEISSLSKDLANLKAKYNKMLANIYNNLSPWQKVQVARHEARPHASDYIRHLITDFIPLAGDRYYGEDKAMIAGIGRLDGKSVMVLGIEKGKTLESRIEHNFGMPNPEGYRKAKRIMELADHFDIPIISFVDTAGAYPGLEAEERGQGEAIARSIAACLEVSVPFISVIIGEGGSGGALGIAASNVILMLEHSVFSVISPEGCASILWKTEQMKVEAAKCLALTTDDLLKFKIIDEVIKEPIGGAHRDPEATFNSVRISLMKHLKILKLSNNVALKSSKHNKFLNIGLPV